ncbi:MAG: sulfotransferase [Phycisphaerales bacterium]|nr:sulfotransferase [Phycisphaerales bacterium]
MSKSAAKINVMMKKAHVAMQHEQYGAALILYRRAYALDKNDHGIMFRLGHVLVTAGFGEEAVEVLKRAVKKKPGDVDSLILLSTAQLLTGDVEGMHASLNKARSWDRGHGLVTLTQVEAYLDSGKTDEAKAVLDALADIAEPHEFVWMARARFARDTKAYGDAIDIYQKLIDAPGTSDSCRRSAMYEFGYVLDLTGEYDRAWEKFSLANAGHIPGKVDDVKSIQSVWTPEVIAGLPRSTIHDERPVMIAGTPRSGTTLMERVINAHPLGSSVGECPLMLQMYARTMVGNLDQEKVDSYAKEYLDLLDKRIGEGPTRIIDKHMGAEKDLGLISCVLPGVRVIQALRDPRDCCLSAYFQNFGNNVSYSRDLTTMGRQYVVYREMMEYWKEHLSIPVYVSVYEEFVADPETSTRSLLEFLGIEFDDSTLKFYESKDHVNTRSSMQVRKPVYKTSTQRWKNYEKHLGPLLKVLGPYADGVMA